MLANKGGWRMLGFWNHDGARLSAVLGVAVLSLLAAAIAGSRQLSFQTLVSQPPGEDIPLPEPYTSAAEDTEAGASFVHHFGDGHDPSRWQKSNNLYPSPHPAWLARQIHFLEDRIDLELRRLRVGDKKYAGAEYIRRGFYGFGRFEVVMRAAAGSGTVSAMFTHTHDQFDGDPHDEIDLEFLGKNLRMVTGNYFTNGVQHGVIEMPLPFDASKEIHLYAFEWDRDEIRWYVDDTLLHTASAADHPIPQAPGRYIIHLWSGTEHQHNWHGIPTFKDGVRASYYCLSYQKRGDSAPQCSDTFDPVAANVGALSPG